MGTLQDLGLLDKVLPLQPAFMRLAAPRVIPRSLQVIPNFPDCMRVCEHLGGAYGVSPLGAP